MRSGVISSDREDREGAMRRMLLVMAAGAALSGCESLITGGDLVREGLPTATLVFHNISAQPIDTVLISTCEASSYGLDRLPDGLTVHPGQRHQWTVSAGCYDVRPHQRQTGRDLHGAIRRPRRLSRRRDQRLREDRVAALSGAWRNARPAPARPCRRPI